MSDLSHLGIVGPFEIENIQLLDELNDAVCLQSPALKDRHVDLDIVNRVFNDSSLQNKVKEYFGGSLALWRSNFFMKKNGDGEIDWHHDRHFESGNDLLDLENLNNHFSILLAVTDMKEDGGIMEYIPSSHLPIEGLQRDLRPFNMKHSGEHFMSLPEDILNLKKSLPLDKGQFVLFHSALLHKSQPFVTGPPRISMIGRLARLGTNIPIELAIPESIVDFN